ncbi:MAG: undecaprenyl-diphosphatase, partial [Alcaligenaceae bacterium]|nr:undecaprenyl-diphosphatase [Alcaligenaceae bacterium]
ASVLANWLVWLIPMVLIIGWFYGGAETRRTMILAALSGMFGLLANQLIGLAWTHPRPFIMGLGHTFIPHAPDSSFPSDHLTLWWAVAFTIFTNKALWRIGAILTLLGIPIAWARIYLGVHFPLDMIGAAIVGGLSTWLIRSQAHWYLDIVYKLTLSFYHWLCRRPIEWGWIDP